VRAIRPPQSLDAPVQRSSAPLIKEERDFARRRTVPLTIHTRFVTCVIGGESLSKRLHPAHQLRESRERQDAMQHKCSSFIRRPAV